MEAKDYFNNGYSCSESIIKWAIDEGLCPEELFPCATSFSGGMSSGCLCGAVAGSQIVLGYIFGRNNKNNNPEISRQYARELIERFKDLNGATCCKVLTRNIEPQKRKQHCTKMVNDCTEIIKDMLKVSV